MADPNLDLDSLDFTTNKAVHPDVTKDPTWWRLHGADTTVVDPAKTSTLLSPGETGPQSRTLSFATSQSIISPSHPARSTADEAAVKGLMEPRQLNPPKAETSQPAPQPKTPSGAGLKAALDNRQKGLPPHPIAKPRHYSDLGKPPPESVQAPHPSEVPNILHSIGDWFAQTNMGSAMNQMFGRQLSGVSDAYVRNYIMGKEGKLRITAEEQRIKYNDMMNSGMAVQQRIEGMLMDATEATGGDPKTLRQRLVAVARKWQSKDLEYMVTHGSAADAITWLTNLDQRYQDLHKANATLRGLDQEQNTEGDLTKPPDQRQDVKPPADQPPSDTGDDNPFRTPSAGEAPIMAPPLPDSGAGAPAQPPPSAPPAAAPEAGPTIVAPGAEPTTPSGQGGFSPSIKDTGSPGAAAGPLPDTGAPVQVAEADSDLTPSWVRSLAGVQTAQAETAQAAAAVAAAQEPPYQIPPSNNDFRMQKSGEPIRATDKVEAAARRAVEDPNYINELKRTGNTNLARVAEIRAGQLWDNLTGIAADPKQHSQDWIRNAINQNVPGLGDTVQRVADGSLAPPTTRQAYGRDPYPRLIQKLVGKIDPSMANYEVYMGRYKNLMSYGPQGVQGKYVMSMVTSLHHVSENVQLIRELDQLAPGLLGTAQETAGLTARALPGESVLGPLLRRPMISLAGKAGPNAARIEELLSRIAANQEFVVEETARAASGAAPHNMEMKSLAAAMDIAKNPNKDAIAAGEQFVRLLQARLRQSADQFVVSTGANPKQNLANYLGKYLPGYTTLNNQPVGPDDLSPEIRQLLGGEAPSSTSRSEPPAAPRSQAPAPSSGPRPGTVENGWRFKGGDPGDQSNWERVQ